MIKTTEQLLAEIGDEEHQDRGSQDKLRRGGRPPLTPPDPRTTEIMKELTERRKALGLSQREVAQRMGVISKQSCMVSWWERGRCQPTLYNLVALVEVLGGKIVLKFEE